VRERKREKGRRNWRSDLRVPDIGRSVQGVRGPCEGGGIDAEGGVRNGNIVDQAVIEEPIGVFPGNHCGEGFPGKLRVLFFSFLFFFPARGRRGVFVLLRNKRGLVWGLGCACTFSKFREGEREKKKKELIKFNIYVFIVNILF